MKEGESERLLREVAKQLEHWAREPQIEHQVELQLRLADKIYNYLGRRLDR